MPKSVDSNVAEKNQTLSSGCRRLRRKRFWVPCAILIILSAYLTWDYYGPPEIPLQPDNAWGLPCLRAKDLVVQAYDQEGNLWATRGMWAYQLRKDDSKFSRQYHIPTGFSFYWLRNFSIVRRLTLRSECVELLPMAHGEAIAMSAGRMWHRPPHGDNFEETLTLRHYGIGVGLGVWNAGLVRLADGTVLFGEYFSNSNRTDVRLYASKDNGNTWYVAHVFRPGQVRHLHAVQQDPYTGNAWICTGDSDAESMVAWTGDTGKTLNPIGQGSQIWRVCELVFTRSALFWGTDTGDAAVSGIYRWDRETHELTKLAAVPGQTLYATRLAGGTIVIATDRVGEGSGKEDKTGLWIITQDKDVALITCGTWGAEANDRKGARLRLARGQDSAVLSVSCLYQREHNGDLLVISEDVLVAAVEQR